MVDTPSLSVPTQSAGTTPEKLKPPFLFALATFPPSQVIVAFAAALPPATTAAPFWTSATSILIACADETKTIIKNTPTAKPKNLFIPTILLLPDTVSRHLLLPPHQTPEELKCPRPITVRQMLEQEFVLTFGDSCLT